MARHETVRDHNQQAIAQAIAQDGPLSRAEIARRLGLSRPSVSRIVDELIELDLVHEGRRVASRTGRPQVLLNINGGVGLVLGVDIRPRKIRFLVADMLGTALRKQELPTQTLAPAEITESVATAARTAISDLRLDAPLLGAAVGISGAWNAQDRKVYAAPNLRSLEGADLMTLFGEGLACPVTVDNDINYAAIGEKVHGAAKGVADFVYLNLGSGIGGAVVVDGRLHRGIHGFAGELGYLPLGPGRRAPTLEESASRLVLEEAARAEGLGDVMQLFELYVGGGEAAKRLINLYVDKVAMAATAAVVTLDPALIVLGGSMGWRSDVLIPRLREQVEHFLDYCPPLLPTELREDAPLLGSVAVALEQARNSLLERTRTPVS